MSTREHSDRRYFCCGVGWRRSEASECEHGLVLRRWFTQEKQLISGFQMQVVDVGCGVAHLEERTRVGGQERQQRRRRRGGGRRWLVVYLIRARV